MSEPESIVTENADGLPVTLFEIRAEELPPQVAKQGGERIKGERKQKLTCDEYTLYGENGEAFLVMRDFETDPDYLQVERVVKYSDPDSREWLLSRVEGSWKDGAKRLREKAEGYARQMTEEADLALDAAIPFFRESSADFWEFPYTRYTPLFEFGFEWFLASGGWVSDSALREKALASTNGLYENYLNAVARVGDDCLTAAHAMADGKLGSGWPTVNRDGLEVVDITAAFVSMMPAVDGLEFYIGDERVAPEKVFDEGLITFNDIEGQYMALCALCASGYESHLRNLLRPKQTRRTKARADVIRGTTDVVSNALFYRPKRQQITPADYMSGEPKVLRSGKDISVKVTMHNDFSLDQALEEYRLDSIDRWWHDLTLSLAAEGFTTFRGSEIMELGGYSNPLAKDMQDTMRSCHKSLMKMRQNNITIDSTDEYKPYRSKRGANLSQATTIRHIINADITYLSFEDGDNDFEVRLNPRDTDDPITAFAVGEYAREKKQLISYSPHDFIFENEKGKRMRLTNDHRRIWKYVIQQVKGHKTSDLIYFDTILENTNLDNVDRSKRNRLLAQLRKMLDARVRDFDMLKALIEKEASGEKMTIREQQDIERLSSMTLISGYKWKSKEGTVKVDAAKLR